MSINDAYHSKNKKNQRKIRNSYFNQALYIDNNQNILPRQVTQFKQVRKTKEIYIVEVELAVRK